MRDPVECLQYDDHRGVDQQQDRRKQRHLRRQVGPDADAGIALASKHRYFGAHLKQAERQAEEEPGKREPVGDLYRSGRIGRARIEPAGFEQDREHGDDGRG